MKKNKKNRIFMAFVLAIQLPQALPAKELTLVTVENSADTNAGKEILKEAYHRIGINLVIKAYPAERAIRIAAAGLADGEVQRIASVGDQYPELIRIEPAINYLDAAAFSRSVEFSPKGWESLRPYRIGIIRGIRFAENNTEGLNRHSVGSYRSLFTMLENGRLDLAIAPRINGLAAMRKSKFRNLRALSPPIAHFELFHYLHRKNATLCDSISEVLNKMRRQGELERIRKRSIQETLGLDGPVGNACSGSPACGLNEPPVSIPTQTEQF